MAKFEVKGELRKGSNYVTTSCIVEADSEATAIELARSKAYSSHPSYRDRDWNLKSIRRR